MCYIECPCHGCKERIVGCHGSCPAYAEFKKENEALNKALRLERTRDDWSRGKYHG